MESDEWAWLGHGGGEMAQLMRRVDWSSTPVGPVHNWSTSLKAVLAMMLHARHPMFLWWGPRLVQFYNDGYVPSFGVGRHPSALGQDGKTCWAEIWHIIGPEIMGVIESAQGTYHDDALVPIFRNGRMEEVYWTYGYSPVVEADGSIAGVLVVVTETTSRVIAQRRLHAARTVAEATGSALSRDELVHAMVESLGGTSEDSPWAVACKLEGGLHDARVLACKGLPAHAAVAVLEAVARQHPHAPLDPSSATLIDLSAIALPAAQPWPEAPERARVLYLRNSLSPAEDVLIVIGLSPRLPHDEAYDAHFRGLQQQLDSAAERIDSQRARFAAESARKDLLMQAPVAAALLVGPRWVYELANPLYVQMVGRPVVGRAWRECFPELRGSVVEDILARVYRDGETVVSTEQLIPLSRESDGVIEQRFFAFNMIPVRSTDRVDAMMVVAVEMTAQVEARRALERTAAERESLVRDLSRVSRAKDEFLAMLGHELRNPLAPITTALRLMELRGTSELSRERKVIERQVHHLTRLVDDLLDVSRIASGKIELSKSTVELRDLVLRAIEVTEPLIEQRAQRLRTDVPETGLWVSVDVARMTQVISNLLTNASKYSDVGLTIGISAERRGDAVMLRVQDSGVGIDADMLPRVFELFSQEPQSVDRSRGGLGLGLSIVRNLMLLHDGSVEAESRGRGQGATFTITLPLAPAPAPPKAASESGHATTPEPRVARRVLIVDDNHDAAQLLADVLEASGHVAKVANDGPQALELLDEFVPELALLDIGLPVMDGYELARKLRAHPNGAHARLFALTGYGQQSDRQRSADAGFDGHFVKPVDPREVARIVGDVPGRDDE